MFNPVTPGSAADADSLRRQPEDLQEQRLDDVREIATLKTALASARRIGAAIGIVMVTHRVTEEDAFARLVTVSQHSNRKLRDVADEIVDTGLVPPDPSARSTPCRARQSSRRG